MWFIGWNAKNIRITVMMLESMRASGARIFGTKINTPMLTAIRMAQA